MYKIERAPTEKELDDMLFGWYVESGVSSNSALFVKDGATVAIGTGEQDRVGVVEIAVFKAYTKFMDAQVFKKFGVPCAVFRLEAEQGKRRMEDLKEIEENTNTKGRPPGLDRRLRRVFPLQRRSGRGDQGRRDGRYPAGRLGEGLRGDPGVQRGGGDDGLYRPAAIQALMRGEAFRGAPYVGPAFRESGLYSRRGDAESVQ